MQALPSEHPFFRFLEREQALRVFSDDPGLLLERILTPDEAGLAMGAIHDLVESCGLNIIEFVPFDTLQPQFTLFYNPDFYVTDPQLSRRFAAMSMRERWEAAELFNGAMSAHGFYCAREGNREALPTDEAMVPSLALVPSAYKIASGRLVVTDYEGRPFEFEATPSIQLVFHLIDGEKTIGEIVAEANRKLQQVGLPVVDLLAPFLHLFSNLRNFGWITLRHKSVPAFARHDHLGFVAAGWLPMAHSGHQQ
jgi:hypothetical protein